MDRNAGRRDEEAGELSMSSQPVEEEEAIEMYPSTTNTLLAFRTSINVVAAKSTTCTSSSPTTRKRKRESEKDISFLVASFLISSTSVPKLVMWGYASWYIVVVSLMPHTSTKPFLDALVIMVLIGFVLNMNAYASFRSNTERMATSGGGQKANNKNGTNGPRPILVGQYLKLNSMSIIRLFLIPYMVSSYSAAAGASEDGTFISIFPKDPMIYGPAAAASVAVPLLLIVARKLVEQKATSTADSSSDNCVDSRCDSTGDTNG